MIQYVNLGFDASFSVIEIKDLYFDYQKILQKKEIASNDYSRLAIRGFSVTSRVITTILNVIKIRSNSFEKSRVLIEKIDRICVYLVLSNGTTVCSDVMLNLSDLNKVIQSNGNWAAIAQIFQNIEELRESPSMTLTKAARLLVIPEVRNWVLNQASNLYTGTASRVQNLYHSWRINSLTKLNLNQIPFYIEDLHSIEINMNYEDIPSEYSENKVFKKFKCSITSKVIRYPVIILNSQKTQPFKLPLQIFERKEILEMLKCKPGKPPVYPNTTETIAFTQVKEYVIIRELIENEMKQLGVI